MRVYVKKNIINIHEFISRKRKEQQTNFYFILPYTSFKIRSQYVANNRGHGTISHFIQATLVVANDVRVVPNHPLYQVRFKSCVCSQSWKSFLKIESVYCVVVFPLFSVWSRNCNDNKSGENAECFIMRCSNKIYSILYDTWSWTDLLLRFIKTPCGYVFCTISNKIFRAYMHIAII